MAQVFAFGTLQITTLKTFTRTHVGAFIHP